MNIKNLLVLIALVLFSFCLSDSLARADTWKYCATEGGVCNFDGTAKVRYGLDGIGYNEGTYTNSVDCNNGIFGDPAFGYLKECDVYIVDKPADPGSGAKLEVGGPGAPGDPSGGGPADTPAGDPAGAGGKGGGGGGSPKVPSGSGSTYGANDTVLSSTMCNAMRLVSGNAGKAFAAFAIISLGIGFFTGKVSWGLMIGVAMGIAAMFGAPSIVAALTGNSAFDCGS